MDTNFDPIRMTLRLPKELREALEIASNASSASVTAEIVTRLKKSFELHPISNEDPNSLIKQCAATILDTIDKTEQKSIKPPIIKSSEHCLTDEEKKLLEEFNSLPKHKRKTAISLFSLLTSLIKS